MTAPDRIWCHPTERQPVPAKDRRNAKWVRGGWKDHNSNAHGDVEYVRADLAAVQPQCCMCGKQGLSTSECDGGAECELHDGRWVCSWRCYDAACSMMVPAIEPHPDYTLAPRLQRIVEASKSAYKWDTVSDRMTAQPDPRDEVIARLVEALEWYADEDIYETQYERMPCDCCTDIFDPINDDKGLKARTALAAAKAVQHG